VRILIFSCFLALLAIPVTVRKDDAPATNQAAITIVVSLLLFSGGGGLIQTTSGCRQQRVLRLQRRGWR
jgi:hypothetical protein